MLSDWIFGRPYRFPIMISPSYMRSMTTDVETVRDAVANVAASWSNSGLRGVPVTTFRIPRGEISFDEVLSLGVHDRNALTVSLALQPEDPTNDQGHQYRTLHLECATATIRIDSPQREMDERIFVEYLMERSSSRPTWKRRVFLVPILAVIPILVGYVWAILSTEIAPPVHVLLAGFVVFVTGSAIVWSRALRKKYEYEMGSIRFRGQSRADTQASRADRRANLKVIAITAPASIAGTLLTTWLVNVLRLDG